MERMNTNCSENRPTNLVDDNLVQLKALFPDAFADGEIDFDALRQLLGNPVDGEEKYGLNWHGKRQARQLALAPSTGTLRPFPEESTDWDDTQNVVIEGANLEVLKILHKSYSGKVKLIYIDPPYNNGNDFIYPDNYAYRASFTRRKHPAIPPPTSMSPPPYGPSSPIDAQADR